MRRVQIYLYYIFQTFCFFNCWADSDFDSEFEDFRRYCGVEFAVASRADSNHFRSIVLTGDKKIVSFCLKALSHSNLQWQKTAADYVRAGKYLQAKSYLKGNQTKHLLAGDIQAGLISRGLADELFDGFQTSIGLASLVHGFPRSKALFDKFIPKVIDYTRKQNDLRPFIILLHRLPSYQADLTLNQIINEVSQSDLGTGIKALIKSFCYYKLGDLEKTMTNLETLDRFGQGLPQLFDEKEFRARYKLRKARDWVPTRKYWELLTDYCKTAKEEERVVEAVYKAAIGAQFNTLKTCLRNGSSASSTLSKVSKEISSGSLEDALKAVPSKDWRLKSAINLYIQSVLDPKSKELAQGLLKRNIGQVKVDGFHTPIAVGMMDHLIPAGKASYAVSVLHEVEKFKKYSARLHNLYGYYYVKIKSYDKALERYKKARRLDANLELLHSLKDVKALRDKAKKEKARKVPKARNTANAKSKSNSSKVNPSQPTLQGIQAQYHIALKKYQSAKNPQEKKRAMSEMKALDAQYAKLKGQSTPAKTKKKSPVVFKDKAGIDKYYGERLAELSAALIKSTSPEQSRQIAKHIESTKKEHTLKLSQLAAMQKNSASKKAGEAHSCHKCKAKLNPNAKFCHQCGTSTQQKANCSKCNKSWPADHKFCQSCGNKL